MGIRLPGVNEINLAKAKPEWDLLELGTAKFINGLSSMKGPDIYSDLQAIFKQLDATNGKLEISPGLW